MAAADPELAEPISGEAGSRSSLGLAPGIRGCLFDLDGVLTDTARVHAAAWKEMFDAFLDASPNVSSDRREPFDEVRDYDRYVDGMARDDGTRSFLASRGVTLPDGEPEDAPSAPTVHGLSNRKNETFLRLIRESGVVVYDGSLSYLHAVVRIGLRRAVVSSSENCRAVLAAGEIADLVELSVDGLTARRDGLRGKPAPDMFLAAAAALGLRPAECAVFEDALAGVEAGRAGHFGQVVGVDRMGQAQALRDHGADVVVPDLATLLAPS